MDASRSTTTPAGAFLPVAALWCLLAGAPNHSRVLGPEIASLWAFVCATGAAIFVHRRAYPRSIGSDVEQEDEARPRRIATCLMLAAFCGLAIHAPLRDAILDAGQWLGLPPARFRSFETRAAVRATTEVLATVALAPVFEEIMYRGRMLDAIAASCGRLPAIATSSLLFALPHLETWAIFAACCVGIALGSVALATQRVSICIALHIGLNVAACLEARGGAIESEGALPLLGSAAGAITIGRLSPRRAIPVGSGRDEDCGASPRATSDHTSIGCGS